MVKISLQKFTLVEGFKADAYIHQPLNNLNEKRTTKFYGYM
jgi:hypothetical protein